MNFTERDKQELRRLKIGVNSVPSQTRQQADVKRESVMDLYRRIDRGMTREQTLHRELLESEAARKKEAAARKYYRTRYVVTVLLAALMGLVIFWSIVTGSLVIRIQAH